MLKYPRTSSSTSSGYFDDDESLMNPYQQSPPSSPQCVPQYLERHMVRMFSTEVDNASGTSAVAIDNKIEQAMDLVKSHLMIAVREEVEVLKERISELMDKINKLELENNILKSNIPQETLQQLQMQLQIAGSQQPAAVAAPPATPAIQAAPASAAAGGAAAPAGGASSQSATPATATSPVQSTVAALPNGSVASESNGSSDAAAAAAAATAAAVAATVTAAATAVEQQQVQSSVNGPMS